MILDQLSVWPSLTLDQKLDTVLIDKGMLAATVIGVGEFCPLADPANGDWLWESILCFFHGYQHTTSVLR